jgi:cell wall assembly regulator SMI1
MTPGNLLARLDSWFRLHRPDYVQCLRNGDDGRGLKPILERVERLPEAMIELYRWHDGQADDCYDSFYFSYQFMSSTSIVRAMVEMNKVRAAETRAPLWWDEQWVPFLDSGGGSNLCIDIRGALGAGSGAIIEYRHDDPERIVRYGSFDAWLHTFVTALEVGIFESHEGDMQPRSDERFDDHYRQLNPGFPVVRTGSYGG